MSNLEKWLSVGVVVDLSGVSPQMVKKAISAGRWHGTDLDVRQVEIGRGGAGGLAPQVHVGSLPAHLREAWYAAQGIDLHAKVDPATGETRMAPDGATRTLGRSTLYEWVAGYDEAGLNGLKPRERSDRGSKKVMVTAMWDGFFAPRISAADHAGVGEELVGYIRSLWASGESGWRAIAEKSTTRLIELSRNLGDLDFARLPVGEPGRKAHDRSQFGLCLVNRRKVAAEQEYRLVAIRAKDNATYQDKIAATVRRDYSQLKPREIVVGDVHPTDIMVRRADGSRAYPKAISWFDPATNEIHMTIALLEPGEGIRREHVAMSFEAMVADWGLPKLLYLDNGSEYQWAEMIGGFSQLSKLASVTVKDYGEGSLADDRVSQAREAVIRSIAYNAKGKPGIEGAFGNLEQVFFSNLMGWTAGDRMRKKTHAKGRDPVPFPGDMSAFMEQVSTALEWYHKRPQHGRLDGRSPNEALRAHVSEGWGKVVLADPKVLALAFSTEARRVVDRGCISFKPRDGRSQRFFLEALLTRPGERITIRVPAYDPQFVFCFDEASGELIGIAKPEQSYHPLDQAGAREVAARNKYLRRQISERARHCVLLDLVDETARHVGHLPDGPEVPVAAVVDAGMLDRMAALDTEERARMRAGEGAAPRRRPSQWGNAQNAALAAVSRKTAAQFRKLTGGYWRSALELGDACARLMGAEKIEKLDETVLQTAAAWMAAGGMAHGNVATPQGAGEPCETARVAAAFWAQIGGFGRDDAAARPTGRHNMIFKYQGMTGEEHGPESLLTGILGSYNTIGDPCVEYDRDDILHERSAYEFLRDQLTAEQQAELVKVDAYWRAHATEFNGDFGIWHYQANKKTALAGFVEDENGETPEISPSHWWWWPIKDDR